MLAACPTQRAPNSGIPQREIFIFRGKNPIKHGRSRDGRRRRWREGGAAPVVPVVVAVERERAAAAGRGRQHGVAGARRDGLGHARLQRLPRPHQVRPQRRHEPGRILRLPRPPRLRRPRPRRLPPREKCEAAGDPSAPRLLCSAWLHWVVVLANSFLPLLSWGYVASDSVNPLENSVTLGFCRLYGNPLLFLVGLRYTNASYAAAFQPSIPVLTFVLAAIVGVEAINISTRNGILKVLGTVVCVSGAILMALYRGPSLIGLGDTNTTNDIVTPGTWSSTTYPTMLEYGLGTWHLGVLCLIGNCFLVAAYLVIQVPVMIRYPASLSLTAYSYFFAAIFMVLTGVLATNGLHEWAMTKTEIIAVLYAGIVASCMSYGIMTWANKILGPSLVALYNPLQPAFSTILSTIFLGAPVYVGSIVGGAFVIAGLYMVTWARYKEAQRAITDGYLDPLLGGPLRVSNTQENSFIDP